MDISHKEFLPLPTEVYDPKTFFPHAASLRQAFAHCAKFPTAASRRSLARVSVPVWLIVLSDQLPVLALVGRYPANKLMGRGLISERQVLAGPAFNHGTCVPWSYPVLAHLSACYPGFGGRLPTRYSPVRRSTHGVAPTFSLDLHVLGAPLAFALSHDQTLQFKLCRL